MGIRNKVIYDAARGLAILADLKPKRGLFGFKYALAEKQITPVAGAIEEGMNEIVMRHVKRDDKNEPVPHESGKGFEVATPEEYEEDMKVLMGTEIEISWPPTRFTVEDIDKAEIEIPNRVYVMLGQLIESL